MGVRLIVFFGLNDWLECGATWDGDQRWTRVTVFLRFVLLSFKLTRLC